MKCPAHAGREKRLKKNRQRHLKIAASLGSLREGAVAVRRLKELAQFTDHAVLNVRAAKACDTDCLLRLEKVPAGRRADEGYLNDKISEPTETPDDISFLLLNRSDSPPSSCCGIKKLRKNDKKLLPQHPSRCGSGTARL